MMSLVCFLILTRTMMTTTMMSYAGSVDIFRVSKSSGESMLLKPSLKGERKWTTGDFRWTHLHLLLNNRTTKCHHGRCELLRDGSLRFSQVQPQDAGNYTLEVYDESGVMKEKKVFQLQVEDVSSSSVTISSLIFCFFLLLLLPFIIFFILRKRRTRRLMISGLTEDNIYMSMHANHSSKGKSEEEEEEEKRKEEESVYVSCGPVVPDEQPEDV